MPEGHTIHALARRIERAFAGHRVAVSSPQGRFADEAAVLDGRTLEHAEARGKHLFVDFALDVLLHVHLGLIGRFTVEPLHDGRAPEPVGAVRLRVVGPGHVGDLRGPMICALVSAERRREIVATLGPDPLDPEASGEEAWGRIHRSAAPVGELLLDQSRIAGVGNVYRSEVLFRQRIDPMTRGRDLSRESWDRIWADLQRLMTLGVAFNQILTMDDQVRDATDLVEAGVDTDAAGGRGDGPGTTFERRFLVYQRAGEPCRRCGGTVRSAAVAGRTITWCPDCQTGH